LRAAIIWLLALALAGVSAGTAMCEGVSGAMRSYRLAPGDRIFVIVVGEAGLSGDFSIDEAGNIQMPLVGTIPMSRITIEECRQRLIERLADGYLKKPEVSVRISELRPIYVLGEVRTPGSYPFRAGLTGMSAVALAGGVGSVESRQSAAMADLIAAEERVRSLEWTRQRAIVRLARIEAERAGKNAFEVPSGVTATSDMSTLIQSEQDQLTAGLRSHEATLGLLRQQKPRVQAEMDATQEQIASEKRQLQLSQARVTEYDRLAKLGLSQSFRELDLQSQTAQREGNISRLNAERARLDSRLGDLDIRLQEVVSARQARILVEFRDAMVQLRDTEVSLPSAREVLLRRQQEALISDTEGVPPSYRIFLLRGEAGRLRPVPVGEEVVLEPGDILEVRKWRSGPGRRATAELCSEPGCRNSTAHERAN
jgi:polysaccharide export outer membrane protein